MTDDWQRALPEFRGAVACVREVREGDAPSLLCHLSPEVVWRHLPRPPKTIRAFELFALDSLANRRAGRGCCFAIVPADGSDAVGVIQLLASQDNAGRWGWGFTLGSAYWGSGLFTEAAHFALGFVFGAAGAQTVDAWVKPENVRALQALRKLASATIEQPRDGVAPDGRDGAFIVSTIHRASHLVRSGTPVD